MANRVIKDYLNFKYLKQIIAVMIVLALILLVGCEKVEVSSENNSTNSSSNVSTQSSSNDSSLEDVNAESSDVMTDNNNSTDSNVTNSFNGDFSFEETVSNVKENVEILPEGNTANLNKPLKGYVDDKAEKLREEILNTGNTEEYYDIKGTKYYVSSLSGDDMNLGTSPENAFKSIEGLSNIELKSGDAVLFERGSVFRLYTTFLTADGVTYGAYGTGEKPKIYGSAINLTNVTWTPSAKKNVWQMDYIYPECAGIFFDHGKEIGYKS